MHPNDYEASVSATRHTLLILQTKFLNITPSELAQYASLQNILDFIHECLDDDALGFTPYHSNILGLRDAADILRLLHQIYNFDTFNEGIVNDVRTMVERIRQMVLEHRDPDTGVFVGYLV